MSRNAKIWIAGIAALIVVLLVLVFGAFWVGKVWASWPKPRQSGFFDDKICIRYVDGRVECNFQ